MPTTDSNEELDKEIKRSHEHVTYLEGEIERCDNFDEVQKLQPRLDIAKAYASGLQRAEHYTALAYAHIQTIGNKIIGEDERMDIQSEFDKIDIPHIETDRYSGLDGVRQASRNILRNHQRKLLAHYLGKDKEC